MSAPAPPPPLTPNDAALPLDSPRWRELAQAYGTAQDVPRLLEHLSLVTDAERPELWLGLWATLCPAGRVYDAAYAALPHLVAFAEPSPLADRVQALHLVAAIEIGRLGPDAPELPDGLAAPYRRALARVPALVASGVDEPWDADAAQVLVAVLALAKGHPRLGSATLAIESVVLCPVCGAPHPPPGWELGGAAGA